MLDELSMVQAFHDKMQFDRTQRLRKGVNSMVYDAGMALKQIADTMENYVGHEDKRYVRSHLLIEELGETLCAMGLGDELKTLDGLADLDYVLKGSALTMDLPLAAAFHEVHRSNMTKTRRADDPGRCRDKGSTFVRPDIAKVLNMHRNGFGGEDQESLRKRYAAREFERSSIEAASRAEYESMAKDQADSVKEDDSDGQRQE